MVLLAIISLVGGVGWQLAMEFRPHLGPEREAIRALYRTLQIPLLPTNDVVELIDNLREILSSKIAVSSNPDMDISGDWRYTCKALDRDYSHGGDAHIDMQMTPYGPQWRLSGYDGGTRKPTRR
jgi:hypothetical protein